MDVDKLVSVIVKQKQEIKSLKEENVRLVRLNMSLTQKNKNLNEKLYKRNESFKGDVWDKDPKKAWRDR